jgi:hypothetical protein
VIRREKEIELFFDGAVMPRGVPAPDEELSLIDITEGYED